MVIFQNNKGFVKPSRFEKNDDAAATLKDFGDLAALTEFRGVKEQLSQFIGKLNVNNEKLSGITFDRLVRFIFQLNLPSTLVIDSLETLESVFTLVFNKYYPYRPSQYFLSDLHEDQAFNTPLYPEWISELQKMHSSIKPLIPVTTGVHQFEVALSRSGLVVGWSCCYTLQEVNDRTIEDENYEYILAHVENVGPIDTLYMGGEVVACQLDIEGREITVWSESYRSTQKINVNLEGVPPGATIFFIPIIMLPKAKCFPNFGSTPFTLLSPDQPQPIHQINPSRLVRYKYIYSCLYRLIKLRVISDFQDYENLFKFLLLKITRPTINNYCIFKYMYPIVEDIAVTSNSFFQTFFESLQLNDEANSEELFNILFSRALYLNRTKTASTNFYPLLILRSMVSITLLRHSLFTYQNIFDVLDLMFSQRPLIFLEFLQNQPAISVASNTLENRFICRKKDERELQVDMFRHIIDDEVCSDIFLKWISHCISQAFTYSKRVAQNTLVEQTEITTLNNLFFIIIEYLDTYLSDTRNTKSFPISIFYFSEPQRQRVGGVYSYLKKNIVINEYDESGEPKLDLKQTLYLYSIDLLQLSFCSYLTLIQKLDAASKIEKRELDRAFDYADYQKVKSSQEATQLKADYLRTEMLEKSEHYEYLWKHLTFTIGLITENLEQPIFEYLYDNTILTPLSTFIYLLGWNLKSTFQNLNFETTNNILALVLKKHGSVVDREIMKATTETVCEFLKRQIFHPIISSHQNFSHFIHMLLEGLTDMDVDLLTFLCTRKFDTFVTHFREICLQNPSCLLKLLNVIFSNLSENISSKHEIPLRLRMFNYLCTNLPHIITGNETSLLITGQFIMYILDKLLLHPNSKDNVYYITFVNMLPSIYFLNKSSKEGCSLKQTITKVNPKVIQMLTDVNCSPDFTQPKKREIIKFFQSIIDDEKKSLNTSTGGSDNLCNICYSYDANVIFNPCKHSSCQHCVTRQLLTKKVCFFCREEIISTEKINKDE
ncbi:hypothetical protein PPL_06660 [Heterostelium album PN500]|uniref:RING-type domain-containing protein n=1 Tax=Heterostelium pallidum (strain ATCC 26659 / Pp 5 / PN500) TaxID=670386 RepID=D3BFC7_HETP5|nr:hypothetical protein PPL_06660 [Heterostelium album PN500]EFA79841.1 hypothetical protein PPL_06660 [Heterostelium album PN500]|eukprot:XP_020431962.1 hypothetical protein PPL_06660 [Heterostelium album PN500]